MSPINFTSRKLIVAGSSVLAIGVAGLIYANNAPYYCASMPRAYWLSPLEVEWRLKEQGYRVAQIKIIDDRCYAIVARDEKGNFVDLVMHPATSDILYRSTPKK